MMVTRSPVAASVIFWWTQQAYSSKSSFTLLILHDRKVGELVLADIRQQLPRLAHVLVDRGYAGKLECWAEGRQGVELEVVYPWWR